MSSKSRFDIAYKTAKIVDFDDTSKIVLFSDCHRSDNSFADDFANNRNIYFHALKHYYAEGFTYCELGDGDELWENSSFQPILEAHKNVFELMQLFFIQNRLHTIWGNHDMVYRNPDYVKKHLYSYFDERTGEDKPLFPNIEVSEGIVLKHTQSKQELFLEMDIKPIYGIIFFGNGAAF